MSQISGALTINDGQATPVARTFSPERVSPELSSFTERTAGVSAGYKRLGLGYSPASSKRPTNRIDHTLDFPVLQTVNGVSTVAYTARFVGYAIIPDQMTAAERADFQAFLANSFDVAQVKAIYKDLDPMY